MSGHFDPQAATRPMPGAKLMESGGNPGDSLFGDWDQESSLITDLPSLEPLPGLVAGRYLPMGVLGAGATATVYEVQDQLDDQRKALKVLDLDDEVTLQRFLREIEVLRKLEHPALVPVLDHGDWSGRKFMVMERVEGPNLLDWIRSDAPPMPFAEAAVLFSDVAEALHEAHQAGIVHRDIKHGNLILETRPDGTRRLRVLDFGLAKAIDAGASLTHPDRVVGSPAFMCPERLFAGATATVAWDVYSLGVVMHEVLSREPLFRAPSWAELMQLIRNRMPPFLSTMRADAPPVLDWLISEMLAKDPWQRPSGCDVVARRLRRMGEQLGE